MNDHFQSLYTNSIEKYPSIFTPESIEASSLYKAYELAASGNGVVAEQIIQHLLIPEDVRANILNDLHMPERSPQAVPILSPAQTVPVPRPPMPPSPIAVTIPIPPQATVTSAPPRPPISPLLSHNETESIDQVTVKPPVPPFVPSTTESLVKDLHTEKSSDTITPISPVPLAVTQEDVVDKQEDTLQAILATKTESISVDSHAARLSENKNLLDEIIQKKQITPIEGSGGDAYNKVFKNPLGNSQYDVPNVIKTYDEPVDITQKKEAQIELVTQKKIEKAKIMFEKAEEYLRKSYASGSDTLIASAERQLINLKNQYPEYVAAYSKHIDVLENIKHSVHMPVSDQGAVALVKEVVPAIEVSGNEEIVESPYSVPGAPALAPIIKKDIQPNTPNALLASITSEIKGEEEQVSGPQEEVSLSNTPIVLQEKEVTMPTLLEVISLAGMEIHPGMRITGEQDVYTVVRIEQYGDYTRVVFEGDISDSMYSVPASDLESALQIEDLHPDTFFAPFAEI